MPFLYTNVDKSGRGPLWTKYPNYNDLEKTKPNLVTYIGAINLSQPISGCQYELVFSRWPRTVFFAKTVTVPGVKAATLDLNHGGFTIAISTHVMYETYEITLKILADKEGYHYYDLRNMVLEAGHPLIAGDPKSMISSKEMISDEDILDIRLRNGPGDDPHHHWIVHNFRPTSIGDIDLDVGSSSFIEFDLTGTFTHITYDCGWSKKFKFVEVADEAEEKQEENEPTIPQVSDTQNNQNTEDVDDGKATAQKPPPPSVSDAIPELNDDQAPPSTTPAPQPEPQPEEPKPED